MSLELLLLYLVARSVALRVQHKWRYTTGLALAASAYVVMREFALPHALQAASGALLAPDLAQARVAPAMLALITIVLVFADAAGVRTKTSVQCAMPDGGGQHTGHYLRLDEIKLPFLPHMSAISATFESNRIHVIRGSNGSGKSTLLAVAAGFMTPPSGRSVLTWPDGREIATSSLLKGGATGEVAYMAQGSRLVPPLTLASLCRLAPVRNLVTGLNVHCDELSRGTSRIVDFVFLTGRQVAGRVPALIILDEPFAALDHVNEANIAAALASAASADSIVIVSEHRRTSFPAVVGVDSVEWRLSENDLVRLNETRVSAPTMPAISQSCSELSEGAPQSQSSASAIVISEGNFCYEPAVPIVTTSGFVLEAGQLVSLSGRNGSGKSCCLKGLAAWGGQYSGRISMPDGAVLDRSTDFETRTLNGIWIVGDRSEYMAPGWVVRDHLRVLAVTLDEIGDALEEAQILPAQPVSTLSGGRLQYLIVISVLSAAMARRARLVLLDEPFAGIDERLLKSMLRRMKDATRQGITVLAANNEPVEDFIRQASISLRIIEPRPSQTALLIADGYKQ
jgi:ABC-type Mn2+/Zn2+ transport system ATPase subunit